MFNLTINNIAKTMTVDIDGVIGVPEWAQFDYPAEKVATYDKFTKTVAEIKKSKAERVIVNIRSAGGNVNDAILIYNALKGLNADVETCCFGYVASAATVIAQAACKGKRKITNTGLYLIHQGSATTEGNAQEMQAMIDLLNKTDEMLANIYAENSGRSTEDVMALMSENNGNGKWLTADEAVEFGLADEVVNSSEVSNFSAVDVKNMKLPNIPENLIQQPKTEQMTKILNKWRNILTALGIVPNDAHPDDFVEIEASELPRIDAKLQADAEQIKALTSERDKLKDESDTNLANIATLSAKSTEDAATITALRAEVAQLKAKQTEVKDKQDPNVGVEVKDCKTAAFENDAAKFRDL